jgi:hypothetical protein
VHWLPTNGYGGHIARNGEFKPAFYWQALQWLSMISAPLSKKKKKKQY